MPLNVRVGLSKQISLPNGSLGASCNIEVEIDVAALRDVEDFDRTVQEAYTVCRHAVDGELQRHGEPATQSGSPSWGGSACRCGSRLSAVDRLGRFGRQDD